MRRALLLCVALGGLASPAFAEGVDLTANACPYGAGSSYWGTLDCAGGGTLALFVTFAPAEDIGDLYAIEVQMDLSIIGDLSTGANFWDFEHHAGYRQTHVMPSVGCSRYRDTWANPGSQNAFVFARQTPAILRIGAVAYGPTTINVQRNEKLFGLQLTIDASGSLESGTGTWSGCPLPGRLVVNQLYIESMSGTPTTPLVGGSVATNWVELNTFATATRRQTWGRLKSLFR